MHVFQRLRSFVAALLGRDRLEQRMRDEIRFHLEATVDALVEAGMERGDAERRARIEFGGLEPVKDACRQARGLRLLDELRQDLGFGFRSLKKNPGFAATSIVTLALGIGATTAIFSVVYAVLIRPLPFPDPDRIVRIVVNAPPLPDGGGPGQMELPFDDFDQVRAQSRTLSDLSIYGPQALTLTGGRDPVRMFGARVSPSIFALLGASPEIGRLFETDEESPGSDRVVLLSRSSWERRFESDPNILGRGIRLDDNLYTVVGVMPDAFRFPDAQTEFWVPFALDPVPAPDQGRGVFIRILGPSIARLAPGIPTEQAVAEIQTIFRRLHPARPERADLSDGATAGRGPGPRGGADVFIGGPPLGQRGAGPNLAAPSGRPLGDPVSRARVDLVPIQDEMVREVRPALVVLLVSVGFVLMIACVNVANLLLTRTGGRQLEIAVRVALGAGRIRLIRQVLTENVVLAVAGGALGILIAYAGIELFIALDPGWVPRMEEVRLSSPVLAFAAVTSLTTGLLFGLTPALRLARADSGVSLNEGRVHRGSGLDLFGRSRMRALLATGEVALAIVLLVGGGLLIHSFSKLAAIDPGYDPSNVLTFSVNLPQTRYAEASRRTAFYTQLLARLREIPSVQEAGGTSSLPPTSAALNFTISVVDGQQLTADMRVVTPGYFETLAIPLLEGRLLTDQDPAGSVVVNETFARRFFPEGALGREIPSPNRPQRIIGVVADVRQQGSFDSAVRPEFDQRYQDAGATRLAIPLALLVRTTGDPLNLVEEVRRAVAELDPALAVDDLRTMEDRLYAAIAEPRFYATALGIFAVIALALAAVGIYGVLAYAVSQRTREIGIRIALGAQRRAVVRMVLFEGMMLTILGVVVGLAGAAIVTRYLEGMLFGLTPLDPSTFVAMTALLILTALVACYVPVRRALGIDPTTALRHE